MFLSKSPKYWFAVVMTTALFYAYLFHKWLSELCHKGMLEMALVLSREEIKRRKLLGIKGEEE